MTYFHRCTSTIIGAKAFHGPVRDGKGWDRLAMVVKRSLLSARVSDEAESRALQSGKKPRKSMVGRQERCPAAQLNVWGLGYIENCAY